MAEAQEVTLEVATPRHAAVLSNLLELYVHDLSSIFGLEVGPDGRFGYDRLPLYWSEPDTHFAFLIHRGDRLAGFALVARGSPATDEPDDLDLAELFVLNAHRRAGVGQRAASLLWDRIPGSWVVRVSHANPEARAFWSRVIPAYTRSGVEQTEHPGKTHAFHAFVFRSDGAVA
jgi:predicted acetyltransferase